MRRKICSLILLISVFVAVFSVNISADNSNVDMTLEEEMKSNISGFDPDTYVGRKGLNIVGASTNESSGSSKGYYLYIYVYDSYDRDHTYGQIDLTATSKGAFDHVERFKLLPGSCIGRSNGFFKFRFDLSSVYSKLHRLGMESLTFSWTFLKVYFSELEPWNVQDFTYYQNNEFVITLNDDGTSDISFEQSEIATLDVDYTSYKTSATEGWKTRDEIHSVWFSVPDEFKGYYDYLYSVSSIYTKKHLKPTLVCPSGHIADFDKNFISSDYTTSVYNSTLGYPTYYYADTVIGSTKDTTFSKYVIDRYIDQVGLIVEGDEDCRLKNEDFIAYIKQLEDMGGKCDFYEGNAEVYTAAFPSTKTVNESWTSIPYVEKASFFDISEEYGFTCGFLMWLYRNSPDKLQEVAERYAVDVNYDKLLSSPQPYLVLVDDETKKEIASLSDAAVSKNYLIGIDDVQSFRSYLSSHNNVVLYRFDVTEYSSEYLYEFEQLSDGSLKPDKDIQYAVFQQSLFFDFRVIDVTFNKDGEYVSLNVYSDPIDVGGDVEVPSDDPPITIDPDVDQIVGDLVDSVTGWGDDINGWFRRALVIVGVVASITAFFSLINVFKRDKINIYLDDRNKKK